MKALFVFFLLVLALNLGTRADDTTHPLMRDFMGLNGHFAFKPDLYRPTCELVRNYHPTVWDLGDDTALPATMPIARNRVDWAATYAPNAGIVVGAGGPQVPISESPVYIWLKLLR